MGIYSPPIKKEEKTVTDYRNYIDEHRLNIKKAFDLYKDDISEYFDCNMEDLLNRVIYHDMIKYSSEEFESYRQFFYPKDSETPDKNKMNYGWLHHIHSSTHHWNYWIIIDEDGETILDMPNIDIAEMLLDWISMGIKFNSSAKNWYLEHYDKIKLSPITREKIDYFMDKFEMRL